MKKGTKWISMILSAMVMLSCVNFVHAANDVEISVAQAGEYLANNPDTVTIAVTERQMIEDTLESGILSRDALNAELADLSDKTEEELLGMGYTAEQISSMQAYDHNDDAFEYLYSTNGGATVYFSFLPAVVVARVKVQIVYEITWSSAPTIRLTDSFGIGWVGFNDDVQEIGMFLAGHSEQTEYYTLTDTERRLVSTPAIAYDGDNGVVGTVEMGKYVDAALYAKKISGVVTVQTIDLSPVLKTMRVTVSYAKTHTAPSGSLSLALTLSKNPLSVSFESSAEEYQTMLVNNICRAFDFLPSGGNEEELSI